MTGRIPQSFIDELLTRSDLVELIDARVPLRKSGSNYEACCPFHNEKNPSFKVSPTKQFYHCFGCGVSGNALSFLMEYERMEFLEAIEALAAANGLKIPHEAGAKKSSTNNYQALYEILEKGADFYKNHLKQHTPAINYLKQRGLSGQIAKEFHLGYAPAAWDGLLKHLGSNPNAQQLLLNTGMAIKKEDGGIYDRFRDRIMFPIRDRRGRVIGFGGRALGDSTPKYLNSPETLIFHKGKELYGLYEARQANRELTNLLIVEGYMDLIALAQHGIRNVVATLGTATTREHLQLLLRNTNEIIFCFDGDAAGKSAAWRALETALPLIEDGVQINFMFLPDGEDPDSLIRKEGSEAFKQRIHAAMPLSEFFFNLISTELNLNSIEGKARLAKPAGALLSKLPAGVFRLRMFDRLAEIVRVDSQQLQSLAGVKPNKATTTKTTTKQSASKTKQRLSPISLAISLLLQNPFLAQTLTDISALAQVDSPGYTLFIQLVTLLKQHPQLSTGALLEHWRNTKEYSLLAKLAAWNHTIPELGIFDEFQGIIQRLQQTAAEQQIELLLAKANQQGLSNDEKHRLQTLITASKKA